MDIFDIVLLGILGIAAVKGYSKGLVVEVLTFAAFFIGLFFAMRLTNDISQIVFPEKGYKAIVFVALLILVTYLVKQLAKLIKKGLDITLLGTLDNVAGAVAGIIKWAFVMSVVIWMFEKTGFYSFESKKETSAVLKYIYPIAPTIYGWLSENFPFINDLFENISKKKDELRV